MTSLDRDKIAAARLWASTRMPYLASAVFASTVRPDPGSRTVGVDQSWTIRADPDVVDRLAVEQLGRLFVHLTGHLVRDHAGRAKRVGVEKDRARSRWNRCADAELNDDLEDDDCVPDVAPDLPADLGAEPGGLAEAYYAAAPRGPRRWDCGSGADGCAREGEDDHWLTRQQIQLLRLGIASDIHQAGKLPGTVPGGWLRWAESVLPSRIDWRRVLAAETRRAVAVVAGKVDYSYRRPSRRADLHPDLVLPTLVQPVPEIAIVCDTSGSMHDRLLGRALAEVEGVLKRTGLRSSQIRVLAVDTAVQAARRVSRANQVVLAGGGGTDMGAGIEAAVALRPRPSVVIVLTDGYTPWPEKPPPGVRVIVGLLEEEGLPSEWSPPDWARTVPIDDLS